MDFSELRFHSRSKKTLKQIYAVVYYMKRDFPRSKAVTQVAKDLHITYNTVDDKLARNFAGSVYTFENWFRSGVLLEMLNKIFRLGEQDTKTFKELLEEDITADPLFPIVEKDLEGMKAEEEEMETNAFKEKEGKQSLRIVRYFERNRRLRTQAIKIHGLVCVVCGFNFERVYGQRGKEAKSISRFITTNLSVC